MATHRLVLHSFVFSNSFYLSEWELGDKQVITDIDPDHLQPMEWQIDAMAYGCHWQGTETLLPAGDHYTYSYSDKILACLPGGTPTMPTPRWGTVTIE
jgi:hypothetical protein